MQSEALHRNDLSYISTPRAGRWLLHLCIWSLYVFFIYLINYIVNRQLHILPTALFLLPHCLTFYVVLYFLRMSATHRLLWSIVVFLVVFVIMSASAYLFFYGLLPRFGITLYRTTELSSFLQGAVMGYLQFYGYALLYYYFTGALKKERDIRALGEKHAEVERQKMAQELDNARLREKELQIRQEKMLMEYAFLQSQINPHFLFNTLNVLMAQAQKISGPLAVNIARLSQIIRYSLDSVEYKVPVVTLKKELDHLRILIDINAMRFGNSCHVDLKVEGKPEDQLVPPLAFITVVENAFKYGDIHDSAHPLCIRLKLRPGFLHFSCRNKKKKTVLPQPSYHIGIRNLHERLQSAFNDRYRMDIINEDDFYTFKLIINFL